MQSHADIEHVDSNGVYSLCKSKNMLRECIDHLNTLTQITTLDASGQLTDEKKQVRYLGDKAIIELLRATNISSLNLAHNKITIDGFNNLSRLSSLTHLSIEDNHIVDRLSILTIHSNLTSLNIGRVCFNYWPLPRFTNVKSLKITIEAFSYSTMDVSIRSQAITFLPLQQLDINCELALSVLVSIISPLTKLRSLRIGTSLPSQSENFEKLSYLTSLTRLTMFNLCDLPPISFYPNLLYFRGYLTDCSLNINQHEQLTTNLIQLETKIDNTRYTIDSNFVMVVIAILMSHKKHHSTFYKIPRDLLLIIFQYAATHIFRSSEQTARMCQLVNENLNRWKAGRKDFWLKQLVINKKTFTIFNHSTRVPGTTVEYNSTQVPGVKHART